MRRCKKTDESDDLPTHVTGQKSVEQPNNTADVGENLRRNGEGVGNKRKDGSRAQKTAPKGTTPSFSGYGSGGP